MNLHGQANPYNRGHTGSGFQAALLNKGLSIGGLGDPTIRSQIPSPGPTTHAAHDGGIANFIPSPPNTDTYGRSLQNKKNVVNQNDG